MSLTAPSSPDLMDLTAFVEDREMDVFDALRREAPVFWNAPSERGPGFWALTRYDDVRDAASNPVLSSAAGTQIIDRKVEGSGRSSLHNMDDPEHAKLRKITVPHLRAVKIQHWNEVIQSVVTTLLDDAEAESGEFNLVDVVSARLPMLVLAQVLGVPAEDAPRMVDWTNRLTSADPDAAVDEGALAEARDEVMGYFRELTLARRANPTDDLVSKIANATKDGVELTWEELAAYYIVIVAAGNETVRHLTSGSTILLDQHRDVRERLHGNHDLAPSAVEEFFRLVTPVAAMRRTALEDLEIGGQSIAKDDKVVLWFSAANRDADVFENPHEFRIDRTPNEHLTFGWGVHFCLGAHLARAEVRAFYGELLKRGIRFDLVGDPQRVRHNIFRGWNDVPVRIAR